jgi:hypothetical protein
LSVIRIILLYVSVTIYKIYIHPDFAVGVGVSSAVDGLLWYASAATQASSAAYTTCDGERVRFSQLDLHVFFVFDSFTPVAANATFASDSPVPSS